MRVFGELEKAEKVLSASLALNKDYLPAILELTDLYRKNNRQKEAQKLLEKAAVRNSSSALVHHLLPSLADDLYSGTTRDTAT